MKKWIIGSLSAVFVLTAALPMAIEAKGKKIEWLESYDEALVVSQSDKKPVLVFFTGSDWCGWCKKLKREVFDKPEFGEAVGDRFIYVVIDQPMKGQKPELDAQKDRLQKQFGVRGLPAVVIVDSNGRQIAKTGYQEGGVDAYVKHLNQITGS